MPNRLAASAEPANEGAVLRQMSTKAWMALEVTGVDTLGAAVVQLARTNRLDKASVRNKVLDMKRDPSIGNSECRRGVSGAGTRLRMVN